MRRWLTADTARGVLREHGAFLAFFAFFACWALRISLQNPIGPGQDQHYHLMGASLTARWWTGDPQVRALYKVINPLDCNTFVYTFLFPFELVLDPVRAWKYGYALLYFLGYPVACAVGLRLMRRSLWPALLAFPLAYVKCWTQGGYMPFVSAGGLFVLAVAGMHRLLQEQQDLRSSAALKTAVLTMVASVLTMLAHGHVYSWLMFVLGAATLVAIGRTLGAGVLRTPLATLKSAFRVGIVPLLVVTPSLLLFGLWYWRIHYGTHAAHETGYSASTETWQVKINALPALLVHTLDDVEWLYVGLIGVLVLVLLMLGTRPRLRELSVAELAFWLTIASYLVLPFTVTGTAIGTRQVDIAMWLLPLVVYPRAVPRAPLRHALAVGAIASFSAIRLVHIESHMRKLQTEYAGMLALTRDCPPGPAELAYVAIGTYSRWWYSAALHQAHETYAAMCRLDTPVYDPTEYPHNFLPIRYRGKPPAPITIMVDNPRWYEHPGLFTNFEYVLVRGWTPTQAQLDEASARATRIRVSGEWQLWARKVR